MWTHLRRVPSSHGICILRNMAQEQLINTNNTWCANFLWRHKHKSLSLNDFSHGFLGILCIALRKIKCLPDPAETYHNLVPACLSQLISHHLTTVIYDRREGTVLLEVLPLALSSYLSAPSQRSAILPYGTPGRYRSSSCSMPGYLPHSSFHPLHFA